MTLARNGSGAITAPTPSATRQPATLAPITSPSAMPGNPRTDATTTVASSSGSAPASSRAKAKPAHAQAHGGRAKMLGEGLGAPDDKDNAGARAQTTIICE